MSDMTLSYNMTASVTHYITHTSLYQTALPTWHLMSGGVTWLRVCDMTLYAWHHCSLRDMTLSNSITDTPPSLRGGGGSYHQTTVPIWLLVRVTWLRVRDMLSYAWHDFACVTRLFPMWRDFFQLPYPHGSSWVTWLCMYGMRRLYTPKKLHYVSYIVQSYNFKSVGIFTYRYTCIALCFSYSTILHHKSVWLYYPKKSSLSWCLIHLHVCPWFCAWWQRLIGCLKMQVIFGKRATNYRALLWKMTCLHKTSYDSTPPCMKRCTL